MWGFAQKVSFAPMYLFRGEAHDEAVQMLLCSLTDPESERSQISKCFER